MSFTSLKRALPKATTAFSSSPLLQTTQRRFASAKYAHMKGQWLHSGWGVFLEVPMEAWCGHICVTTPW